MEFTSCKTNHKGFRHIIIAKCLFYPTSKLLCRWHVGVVASMATCYWSRLKKINLSMWVAQVSGPIGDQIQYYPFNLYPVMCSTLKMTGDLLLGLEFLLLILPTPFIYFVSNRLQKLVKVLLIVTLDLGLQHWDNKFCSIIIRLWQLFSILDFLETFHLLFYYRICASS